MKDKKKMFDYCIGNTPYNSDFSESGQNGNYAKPVYNVFMDATYEVAEKVELIHPARFLFNAGSTPKAWNDKMLHDEHFEILRYEQNSDVFFPSLATPIKGGIAISYRDNTKSVGAIGIFTPFPELNTIMHKVWADKNTISLSSICVSSYAYHFTETLHKENKLSTEIVNRYDAVCIKDLDMKAISNKGFGNGKATMDNGYGMFQNMLSYKLAERGKHFVVIDKWYPSSPICHVCGHQQKMPLKIRIYQCPECGMICDRDLNAVINIKMEGLRLLSA